MGTKNYKESVSKSAGSLKEWIKINKLFNYTKKGKIRKVNAIRNLKVSFPSPIQSNSTAGRSIGDPFPYPEELGRKARVQPS